MSSRGRITNESSWENPALKLDSCLAVGAGEARRFELNLKHQTDSRIKKMDGKVHRRKGARTSGQQPDPALPKMGETL
jgi:hypothetical protein